MILKDLICKKCHHIWKAICEEKKIKEMKCNNDKCNETGAVIPFLLNGKKGY